jgi:hypothetical protein
LCTQPDTATAMPIHAKTRPTVTASPHIPGSFYRTPTRRQKLLCIANVAPEVRDKNRWEQPRTPPVLCENALHLAPQIRMICPNMAKGVP